VKSSDAVGKSFKRNHKVSNRGGGENTRLRRRRASRNVFQGYHRSVLDERIKMQRSRKKSLRSDLGLGKTLSQSGRESEGLASIGKYDGAGDAPGLQGGRANHRPEGPG